jgi:hypothetical protein
MGGCLLLRRNLTLEVVQGSYVVSVQAVQRKHHVAELRSLALVVLAKAMSVR